MTGNNPWGHEPDDPSSDLNAIEAAWLATDQTVHWCDSCKPVRQVIPMSGTGWGVEVFHEPWCPLNEDNQPPPQQT